MRQTTFLAITKRFLSEKETVILDELPLKWKKKCKTTEVLETFSCAYV